MPKSIRELESDIAELSDEARDLLIRDLIAGLDAPAEDEVEQAWSCEIQRRYRELKEGTVESIPVEDVVAKARRILNR